ncbi:hypothetical protein N2152v2_003365 [Parachlorella kessleri]
MVHPSRDPAVSEEPVDEEQNAQHDDEDEHEDVTESDASEADEGGEGSGARKKKKKKKKKKRPSDAQPNGGGLPQLDAATRKEADKRFHDAVELLASDSDDSMWVRLDGAHVPDSKIAKLCEALQQNKQILSLDLAGNHITSTGATVGSRWGSTGAVVLAGCLKGGAAPDLIELNLQDNPIDGDGQTALEELQQARRSLKVSLGPSQPPPPEPQQQQPKQQQGQGRKPGGTWQQQGSGPGSGGLSKSLAESVKNNALLRQFFQVGNEDEDEDESKGAEGGVADQGASAPSAAEQEGGRLTAEHLSQLMWDQVSASLDSDSPYLPDISAPLRAVAEQVEEELATCQLPLLSDTCVDELKPFSRQALAQLPLLGRILDLEPPPLLTTYSRTTPVPAVGTHRAAVAELLSQLLRSECPSVAVVIAASGLLPRCTALAVSHPNCNALHCSIVRCLRHALSEACGSVGLWRSAVGGSWTPALAPDTSAAAGVAVPVPSPAGAGRGAANAASSGGAAGGAGRASDSAGEAAGKMSPFESSKAAASKGLVGPGEGPCLAHYAAQIASGARDVPVGKRSPHVGFALAASELLQAAASREMVGSAGGGSDEANGSEQHEEQHQREQPKGQERPTPGAQQAKEEQPASEQQQEEEVHSWHADLRALLAACERWQGFTGQGGPLPDLLEEQQGELGGPKPGREPERGDEGEEAGHIISGQELLMMLRGLNMGYSA